MKKVLCFGELLLRFSPELNGRWIKNASMPVYVGGAELNVAKAVALWGTPTKYCTAIPDNSITKEIITGLKNAQIDTEAILFREGRVGIYYLPQGADLKHAEVIYDRKYSSFYNLQPGMIDWHSILKDVSWFHFSAITPALNESLASVCEEGLKVARSLNIPVSVDLNYRSRLWQYGKDPVSVMTPLAEYCDVIMGNIWSANTMLNISINNDDLQSYGKEEYLTLAKQSSDQMFHRFDSCKQVAFTFRFDEGNGLRYYGSLYDRETAYHSKEYFIQEVIDKVGSGDCFMAGLIHSHANSLDPRQTIEFATAAAFSKLRIQGDSTNLSIEEINEIRNEH